MRSDTTVRAAKSGLRAALLLPLLAAAGCGGGAGGSDPLPTGPPAPKSLEVALDAWKAGREPGPLTDAKPSAVAFDSVWQSGKKLADYRVVGEETGQGIQRFSVRMKLAGAPAEQDVKYVVTGKEPVWV